MQKKKVLIISYYWPPAGGPGVQRWLKFVKYLPDFGIEPTIFTPENPSYPLVDNSLLSEVPKDIKVIKTKIWEPYQIAEKLNKKNKKFKAGQFDIGGNQSWKSKLSIWIRGNFFIPDARIFWVKPSIQFLKKHLENHYYDAIITSGPPHSLHLIGLGLKKENPNLKWIADFRDPWTEISYYQHLKLSHRSDKKHRFLEKEVFKNADITLATSYTDAENFKRKGANAICITNGFDTEIQRGENKKTTKFTLSYVGVLEQLRNPEILWEVLEELVIENENFRNDFQLKFVGKIDDTIQEKWNNLNNSFVNLGYLPHSKAVEEMQNADILLLTNFPNENSKGIIPGKIFEYLATQKTILAFGCQGADVEKILQKTNAGKHFTYTQKEEVKAFILEQYQIWKTEKPPIKNLNIAEFSRKNLTEKLANVLKFIP
ncbi:MAG: glycosyl transferase family 1 [Flavobacteriales bacterium]|nr:MAG: glycosyl transferase family 1 [Flavobacteriales bacterium]